MVDSNIHDKIDLIIKLGMGLHRYGANAYRIELALKNLAHKIGLEGEFFFTPTYMFGAFRTEFGEINRHVRIEPGGVNLDKLCSLDELGDNYLAGKLTAQETDLALDEIEKATSKYHPLLKIFCFGMSSAAVSLFLFSELYTFTAAILVGLVVGCISYLSSKIDKMNSFSEVLVAFIATVLAYFLALTYPQISFSVILLSGLIVLIPGLNLTVAIAELARNHLASGTARFMGAMISLLKLAFGVAIGIKILSSFGEPSMPIAGYQLPQLTRWVAVIFAGFSFTVLFDARIKDCPWILLSAIIGSLSSYFGNAILGAEIGPFLAGLSVGALSNVFARIHKRPASLTLIPGIILLVPGSFGYITLSYMFDHNVVAGLENAFLTLSIAISIVMGLLIGNILIDPRKNL